MVGRVLHDLAAEGVELLLSWELSVDKEERSLEETCMFSKLFNRVASVLEDSLISVDERDFGDARDSVHAGGVE